MKENFPYKSLMPKIAPLKNYSTLKKIKAEVITPKEFFGEISCSETQLYKNKWLQNIEKPITKLMKKIKKS